MILDRTIAAVMMLPRRVGLKAQRGRMKGVRLLGGGKRACGLALGFHVVERVGRRRACEQGADAGR